jgi:serine protease inhibitor
MLKDSKSKSVVISPTSISAALALVLLGAKGNTYQELLRTMQLPNHHGSICQVHQQFGTLLTNSMAENNNSEPGVLMNTAGEDENVDSDVDDEPRAHKISVANALFLQNSFNIRKDYENAVRNVYQSSINRVDFLNAPNDAANTINQWVNEKTYGKIKQIIGNNISPDAKMIIASALYFKAEWRKMFIEGANMNRKFYPDGKENGKNATAYMVEMMAHGGIFPFYQSEEFNCRIMGFTYAHGESTMYVIFPIDSDREKLVQLQEKLTAEKIEAMITQMKNTTAVVLFPKMKLSSNIQLKRVLQNLGLESLFNIQQSDLSLMSNGLSSERPFHFPIVTEDHRNWNNNRSKRDVKYKVESSVHASEPLNIKDLILRKRISKKNPGKKSIRHRRELQCDGSLGNLDALRNNPNVVNPLLYADDIVHKVELEINERGTEGKYKIFLKKQNSYTFFAFSGGAATAITLNRSGTKVVFRVDGPFLLLIRHESTKLPLFYGSVFEPPGAN